MNLWMFVKERSAEYIGKLGISGIVTTEAGKAAGVFDNVTAVQVISVAGVLYLMIDRTINSINQEYTTTMKSIVISVWLSCWCLFLGTLWAVII